MTSARSEVALTMFCLALAGCGHSAPTRYLTLTEFSPAAPLTNAPFVVRPLSVRWPAALDRLEVMQPTDGVRVLADEFSRWSAAPGQLAAAALTEDLQARLPGLVVAPTGGDPEAIELTVDIMALERDSMDYKLTANIDFAGGGAKPRRLRISLSTFAGPPDAADEARAASRLLGLLADRIACELAAPVSQAASALPASLRPTP